MTTQENYIRRVAQGATVPARTELQSLIAELCDADRATTTNHYLRRISSTICTCQELALAAQEEYLDRWAEGVFRLFDPYDYQRYRTADTTDTPLFAFTTSPGER